MKNVNRRRAFCLVQVTEALKQSWQEVWEQIMCYYMQNIHHVYAAWIQEAVQHRLQHNRILHWYREFKEAGVYIIRVLAGQPQVWSLSVLYRQHQNKVHWNCCDGYCLRHRYHTAPVSVLAVVPRLVLNWMTSWIHIVNTLCLCCAYQIMHIIVCWIVIVKFVSVLLPTALNWSPASIHFLNISQWFLCQFVHINFLLG